MAEDREAIQQHVQLVRERLYPAIRVDRFPDAKKLTARVETIVGDWKAGGAPDASGVIEAVNEICVAIELLRQKLTAHFTLIYEPSVTLTGRPQGGVDRGACALAKERYVSKALRLLLGRRHPFGISACGRRVPAPPLVSNSCTAKSSCSATAARGRATMSSPMG
jgi:hypothetical protein